MEEFLKFFNRNLERSKMHFEVSYNFGFDWYIEIGADKDGECDIIFKDSGCDPEYLFAEAQIALKDFLIENKGGYKL